MESINTTASQQLVQEAAAQGLVLLRNNDSVLPLGKGQKVAVVGSHALATRELLSDYYGDQVCFGPASGNPHTADGCILTIGASVEAANAWHGGVTKVIPGVSVTGPANTSAEALAAVAWSDVVVLALGLEHALEHGASSTIVLPIHSLAPLRA
jgi:beta-glucosidase-like glycosyl hydrolase